jgi:hypothetical protein
MGYFMLTDGYWSLSNEVRMYAVEGEQLCLIKVHFYVAEFCYDDVFRLWETIWAARKNEITTNFEEFFALAIMKQFKYVSFVFSCGNPLPNVL